MAEKENSLIHIPGIFYVELDESGETPRVVRFSFSPLASDAGYFGESAEYVNRSPWIHTVEPLDLEDVDGPFWKAMQKALLPCDYFPVGEPESDETITTHAIPIEWTE